jgi:hypothetical protein
MASKTLVVPRTCEDPQRQGKHLLAMLTLIFHILELLRLWKF